MLSGRQVVITGIGVYTPLGLNVLELVDNLINGNSSVRFIGNEYPLLNTCNVQIGSIFDKSQLTREKIGMTRLNFNKLTSHCTKVAFPAVKEAVDDSGIFNGSNSYAENIKERTGVAIGAGFGGISDIEKNTGVYLEKGLSEIDKFMAYKDLPGATSGHIANSYGLHGGCVSIASACATGLVNPIYICMGIQLGLIDAGIAGGTGDPSLLTFGSFDRLDALSRNKREPSEVSRPFDKNRDGFVVGEGAGIIILEEMEHAKKRGANIYAKVLGYSDKSDGTNPIKPRDDAKYLTLSMLQAQNMAEINPNEIGYINAHGTSTIKGDKLETLGIKRALGDYARKVPISSLKGNFGHLLNAAGTVELIACLDMMKRGTIYPTLNLDEPDLENGCDLDYVPNNARGASDLEYILTNSVGFAGRNTSMVLGKV